MPAIDFASLCAQSPNPYVVLDRDLTIVWMNAAYLAITGRQRDEIVGLTMFEAFPSDPDSESHRLLDRSLRRVIASGEPDEIALIRYDIVNSDGAMEDRYWSATHTPLFGEHGAVAYVLQHTVDVTELHGLRTLRDEMGMVKRADAIQSRNRDLSEERDRFRMFFEQAPGFVAVLGGPQHVFLMANEAYRQLTGNRELIGKPLGEALPEVVEQGFADLLDRVRDENRIYLGERAEVFLDNGETGESSRRFLNFAYQPLVEDGEVAAILVQGHDVTDEVLAAEGQRLLINELNHRVKNTLAIVQGLASQSFRRLDGASEATAVFDARLNALAAAHSLLTERNWEPAQLAETVRGAVEATTGSDRARFTFNGPDLTLPPQTGVSLAMIVHELCTNAIKYGALSVPGGTVAIDWKLEPTGDHCDLSMDWRESGGPPVSPPTGRGFGTRLIERGLSAAGHHAVTLDFRPGGLQCHFTMRVANDSR